MSDDESDLASLYRWWPPVRPWLIAGLLFFGGFALSLFAIMNDTRPTLSKTWIDYREEYEYTHGDVPDWVYPVQTIGTLMALAGLIMLAFLGIRAYLRRH